MKKVTTFVDGHLNVMEQNQRMQITKMTREWRNTSIGSLEEVTSMWKSMIRRGDSMHEQITSQIHSIKEHECTLDSDISKIFKVFYMQINGDKAYMGKMWSKANQLSYQDKEITRSILRLEKMSTMLMDHFNFSTIKDLH